MITFEYSCKAVELPLGTYTLAHVELQECRTQLGDNTAQLFHCWVLNQ